MAIHIIAFCMILFVDFEHVYKNMDVLIGQGCKIKSHHTKQNHITPPKITSHSWIQLALINVIVSVKTLEKPQQRLSESAIANLVRYSAHYGCCLIPKGSALYGSCVSKLLCDSKDLHIFKELYLFTSDKPSISPDCCLFLSILSRAIIWKMQLY